MKKILAILLALCMMLTFAACGAKNTDETTNTTAPAATTEATIPTVEAEFGLEETLPADAELIEGEAEVMTYAQFAAAELEAAVKVEATIQAAQKYNAEYGNTSLYLQNEEGAYFVYRLACTEDEYAKLTAGTVVAVSGYKAEWAGEVEIIDATYEIVEGGEAYVAEALDVTEQLGTDALIENINKKVAFNGMTVAASKDAEGNEVAFLYAWDGSGSKDANSDLYFNVSYNGATYNFCVESDLCDNTSDVYAAVEALKIGDTIDLEGFLYWYEGANPHITAIAIAE